MGLFERLESSIISLFKYMFNYNFALAVVTSPPMSQLESRSISKRLSTWKKWVIKAFVCYIEIISNWLFFRWNSKSKFYFAKKWFHKENKYEQNKKEKTKVKETIIWVACGHVKTDWVREKKKIKSRYR